MVEHSLSCPKGGLVLERHDDSAKDWGALGARALVPIFISYEPKINSRTFQGESTRSGARQEGGTDNGGVCIVGEGQGGGGCTLNRVARLGGRP